MRESENRRKTRTPSGIPDSLRRYDPLQVRRVFSARRKVSASPFGKLPCRLSRVDQPTSLVKNPNRRRLWTAEILLSSSYRAILSGGKINTAQLRLRASALKAVNNRITTAVQSLRRNSSLFACPARLFPLLQAEHERNFPSTPVHRGRTYCGPP